MPAKRRFIIINLSGIALALFCYFGLGHQGAFIDFSVFGIPMAISPGYLLFASYSVGVMLGISSMVAFAAGNQHENVAKLKEWQEQDAKLAIEVQSDKEKQLEAKIATLESALQKALGK